MSWCRANIGIGTDFAEPLSTYESVPDLSLPFSLKTPLLSRAQVEAARRVSHAKRLAQDAAVAERVRGGKLSSLSTSLGTSLTAYLLDLLDSPAYANLTPNYLQDVFNPATPDRDDIAYYSIAARTPKINILHPLWLPKQVLDGAEASRLASRGEVSAQELANTGNDGLVTVESAKWGHFLGTLEHCDHWEVRGSSGLLDSIAKETTVTTAQDGTTATTTTTVSPQSDNKGWQWQDVYALVGKSRSKAPLLINAPVAPIAATPAPAAEAQSDETRKVASLASWIVRRLPSPPSLTLGQAKEAPTAPVDPRMLYGLSTGSPSNSAMTTTTTTTTSKPSTVGPSSTVKKNGNENGREDKFNLERMTLALCRKLYNDGF